MSKTMKNEEGLSLPDRAAEFALRKHRNQLRKGSDIPYIAHPFAVCLILARIDCDDEVLAAALLHDTLEDTETTAEELQGIFGEAVTAIVKGCSEPDKSLPWEERKEHTIHFLRSASLEIRLVAAADKLHNARSISEEWNRLGEGVWERFNRGPARQEWYYRSVFEALNAGEGDAKLDSIISLLATEVDYLFPGEQ